MWVDKALHGFDPQASAGTSLLPAWKENIRVSPVWGGPNWRAGCSSDPGNDSGTMGGLECVTPSMYREIDRKEGSQPNALTAAVVFFPGQLTCGVFGVEA